MRVFAPGSPPIETSITLDELNKNIVEVEGRKDFFALRKRWSRFLKWMLFLMIYFQIMLAICIGFGWMDFSQYQKFLYCVIGENFVQIIGLCYIIVNYLFKDKV